MRDHHHVINADTLRDRILQLESEHSGLDRLIDRMSDVPGIDDLELRRLKKRKLKVKDTIILLQLQLEPDARAESAAWQAPGARRACRHFAGTLALNSPLETSSPSTSGDAAARTGTPAPRLPRPR